MQCSETNGKSIFLFFIGKFQKISSMKTPVKMFNLAELMSPHRTKHIPIQYTDVKIEKNITKIRILSRPV